MTSVEPDLISVIIPARDRAQLIGRQLTCLAAQDIGRPFEVIVADNGSTDDTVAVARSFADRLPGLKVVDASAVPGSAAARNAGVVAASGELLAFCDSDDAADEAWLRELMAVLEADRSDEGVIVAGRMQFAYEDGPTPTPAEWRPFEPRQATMGFLPFADTASMAIRRRDLERIGRFDPAFLRCSDQEVSWRAQVAGMRLVDAPEAMMLKYQPADRSGRWRKIYGWAQYQPLMYRRYRDAGMPGIPPAASATAWAKLAGRTLLCWMPRQRTALRRTSAPQFGRLAGSIRFRTWYV